MDRTPLMPKATAVWLVDNTSLTFEQIAEFCGLHVLEVKGIADGDVAHGIKGMDPISSGQLTRDEIAKAEKDSSYRLKLAEPKVEVKTKRKPATRRCRAARIGRTPLAAAQEPSRAQDSQIMRLVGTTKPTIAIRERSHWNPGLVAQDPVALSLARRSTSTPSEEGGCRLARERHEVEAVEPPRVGTHPGRRPGSCPAAPGGADGHRASPRGPQCHGRA